MEAGQKAKEILEDLQRIDRKLREKNEKIQEKLKKWMWITLFFKIKCFMTDFYYTNKIFSNYKFIWIIKKKYKSI